MIESKHVLTSKIFLTGLVTVLSGLAMMIADHYGVSLDISLTMQGGIVTVLGGLVAYWRNRPTKALHVKKPKVIGSSTHIVNIPAGVKNVSIETRGGGGVAADRLKTDKEWVDPLNAQFTSTKDGRLTYTGDNELKIDGFTVTTGDVLEGGKDD